MNNSLASMSAMSATLPPGWEQKMTSEGKVYYEHHGTKTTSWTIPDRLVVLPSTYGNANSGCCGDCVPITLEPTGLILSRLNNLVVADVGSTVWVLNVSTVWVRYQQERSHATQEPTTSNRQV